MKLRRDDQVMVIAGKDKGKTGKITQVIPKENAVVVEGVNMVKRHTKPSNKNPQGGILEIVKPISAAKVMVLDPTSGKPARVGYRLTKDGVKERVFKLSRYAKPQKADKKSDKPGEAKAEKKADKPADKKEKKA